MMPVQDQLKAITQKILDPSLGPGMLREATLELKNLFQRLGPGYPKDTLNISEGESPSRHGIAVSPEMAARCLDDFKRTTQFLHGVHDAIQDRLKTTQGRPVRVLYAGCGPYDTLGIPLMTLFTAEEVTFTLIDIHQVSLDHVASLIQKFKLQDRVTEMLAMDAADHTLPPEALPDVIVMEVMQSCLMVEPQVALSRHFLGQAPEATLVPERIAIELVALDPSKEHQTDKQVSPDREILGETFVLDRETIASWKHEQDDILPGASITLPKAPGPRSSILLFTRITTYGPHVLSFYDCGLSYARSLSTFVDHHTGDLLKFSYQLGERPSLLCVSQGSTAQTEINPTRLSLRPVTEEDDDFLFGLFWELRADQFAQLSLPDAQVRTLLRVQFEGQRGSYAAQYPEARTEIILLDSTPVGQWIWSEESDHLCLIDISLLENSRGKGIGSQIVSALLDRASSEDLPIRGHVAKDNPKARDLWQRLGFQITGEDQVYFEIEFNPTPQGDSTP